MKEIFRIKLDRLSVNGKIYNSIYSIDYESYPTVEKIKSFLDEVNEIYFNESKSKTEIQVLKLFVIEASK